MYSWLSAASAGYEPRRLYNVAEFLMNDKDNSGKVSVEEVMQILFLRYGRQLLDSQLEEIFGTSDTNSGTRDLSLTEFLTSLNQSQARLLACNRSFWNVVHARSRLSMTLRYCAGQAAAHEGSGRGPKGGQGCRSSWRGCGGSQAPTRTVVKHAT